MNFHRQKINIRGVTLCSAGGRSLRIGVRDATSMGRDRAAIRRAKPQQRWCHHAPSIVYNWTYRLRLRSLAMEKLNKFRFAH